MFGRAKEWLLLYGLRVRGLAQVSIHVSLSLISMLTVALSAVRLVKPGLVRSIKYFTVCVVSGEDACLSYSMVVMMGSWFPKMFWCLI